MSGRDVFKVFQVGRGFHNPLGSSYIVACTSLSAFQANHLSFSITALKRALSGKTLFTRAAARSHESSPQHPFHRVDLHFLGGSYGFNSLHRASISNLASGGVNDVNFSRMTFRKLRPSTSTAVAEPIGVLSASPENCRQARAHCSIQRVDCGQVGKSWAHVCGMPRYCSHITRTPCCEAVCAMIFAPSASRSCPHAIHIGGASSHETTVARATSWWQSKESSQYGSLRGGQAGQILSAGKLGCVIGGTSRKMSCAAFSIQEGKAQVRSPTGLRAVTPAGRVTATS